jgi:hypothetical protein
MLYCEHSGRGTGWLRVFSSTDNFKELDEFRCLVRAPRCAVEFVNPNAAAQTQRLHLRLFAKPAQAAVAMIPTTLVFSTPVERAVWERSQPDIAKKYPVAWMGR